MEVMMEHVNEKSMKELQHNNINMNLPSTFEEFRLKDWLNYSNAYLVDKNDSESSENYEND